MDNLKLMAANKNHLEQLLKIVEEVSSGIGMQIGLEKCRTINIHEDQERTRNLLLVHKRKDMPVTKK